METPPRVFSGTCWVFQAVGQSATLPRPLLSIEHCVESQLIQLKGSPLEQGDLVLNGQVPGNKDGEGMPPLVPVPYPLMIKSGEGE